MIDWLVERKGWAAAVDWVAGLLFSAGCWGEGAQAVAKRDEFADWLKSRRKETLGVVLDAYQESVKKGRPMLKDGSFWLSILPTIAIPILERYQASIGEMGMAAFIVGAALAICNYVREHKGLLQEEAKERTARTIYRTRALERGVKVDGGIESEF